MFGELGFPKIPSPPLLFQVTPEAFVILAVKLTNPPEQILLTSPKAVTVGGSLNIIGIMTGSETHPSTVTNTHRSFKSAGLANCGKLIKAPPALGLPSYH